MKPLPDTTPPSGERRFAPARLLSFARRHAAPIAAIAVCVLLLALFQHLSRVVDYHSLVKTMKGLSPGVWAASLGATVLSYIALVARDAVGLRYVDAKIPAPALWVGATVGSALGNATGFGALTGGAIRVRVYGAVGVSPMQVGRLTAFTSLTLALTLALMTGLGMVFAADALSHMFRVGPGFLKLIGSLILAAFALLLLACRDDAREVRLPALPKIGVISISIPSRWVLLAELLFSAADVVAAGLALWVILPAVNVSFVDFIAVYAAALLLGMIGHTPGGLGV